MGGSFEVVFNVGDDVLHLEIVAEAIPDYCDHLACCEQKEQHADIWLLGDLVVVYGPALCSEDAVDPADVLSVLLQCVPIELLQLLVAFKLADDHAGAGDRCSISRI